ncbi:MAG: hypothetical protein RMH75_06175 [Archaeoglobaceae archaeon]|nr:hypothetical protein [Archaeoglobaceae archaeon]
MARDEITSFSKFLSEEDQKILRTVIKDPVTHEVLKKLFEEPETAEKYLLLIKDNINAIFLAAKLAESIGRYLDGEDEEKCLNIFLRSIEYLKGIKDRKAVYSVFNLVREAIDNRITMEKYETASKLVNLFLELGFGSYLRKLVFHAIEIADSGDYARSIKILDNLPELEDVLTAKAYILVEWGKKLSVSDPELALSKVEEALKLREIPSAKLVIAEIFENLGNYPKAYEIYKSIKDQPSVEKRLVRLLMEWGEEEKDIKKLEEAKSFAYGDPLIFEEIERRIRKIKS